MKYNNDKNCRCDRCRKEDVPPFANITQVVICGNEKDLCLDCRKVLDEVQLKFLKALMPK